MAYTRNVRIKRIPKYLMKNMDWETLYYNIVAGNFCQVFNVKRKVWEYWLIGHKDIDTTLMKWKRQYEHEYIQRKLKKIMES